MTGTGNEPWVTPAQNQGPRTNGSWLRRHWVPLLLVVIALLVGVGIGAAGSNTKKKDNEITAQKAQIQNLTASNAALNKQVNDRAAQTAADNARAAAVKANEQAARDRAAAAAAKAKADAVAKVRADAAAKAKAQADAAAAAAAAAAKKNTIDGDGVFAIGPDINPGQWRTSGGPGCYYAILNSPDTEDIATNNLTDGPAIANLPLGKYFDTTNCGGWTHP